MERKLSRKDGFGPKKIWRAALFASTALSAVLSLPAMVRAQTAIPSDTTPQGGVVVGGSASIAQAPASTTINQNSERAAINWQSFDVGSGAKVQFNQPDTSAIALNRVVGGNLSQINGQINANGQIVLINQSGVVFGRGSQVNAENIVVSTSDIATKDFMAGNMAFTGAPNPGAKILNEGKITVKDTGLVGLIAPQVENDGLIVARLGQVVLAGASAFTLDMYGDKLISLDVTKSVQTVDVNGVKIPALVTNRGVILANGGKVTLTAQDADALVTQLINAGGTIRADSVGSQTGTISIQGVGGDISIAGNLLARGGGTGSSGGKIEALTTGTVSVAPSAVIDASGNAGGGVIAIGTDIARAQQGAADVAAPKAAAVNIAQDATLNADATGRGNAGTVTLLSSQNTAFDGAISIQGGPQGGNGGTAEISSDGVISLGGTVLATAINGREGEILLDPQTLVVNSSATTATISGSGGTTIVGDDNTATVTSNISNTNLDALSGTIILEAASLISVTAPVNSTSIQTLSLVSQGGISVTASIDISGSLDLDAAGSLSIGAGLTASNVLLTSGATGTDINAGINAASGTVTLGSAGTIFEGAGGSIVATHLFSAGSIGGDVTLANSSNTITTLEGFTLGGNLTLANSGGLTVGGSVSAANISLSGASLTFESGVNTGLLALSSTGTISQGAGTITAGTLTGSAVGDFALTKANAIGTLGAFSASNGSFSLDDTSSLNITGAVSGAGVSLAAPTIALAPGVTINATTTPTLALASDDITLGGSNTFLAGSGTIEIAPFSSGTTIDFGSASSAGTLGLPGSLISALDSTASTYIFGSAPLGHQASVIDIDTSVSFANTATVDLSTSGTILENSGSLSTDKLEFSAGGFTQATGAAILATLVTGTATGNVVLGSALNTIVSLGAFSDTSGTLDISDSGTLTISGAIDPAAVTLFGTAGLDIAANVSATSLVLGSDGTITQTAGSITTATLASDGNIGGGVSLTGANSISSFGTFATGGNLDVNDSVSLDIAGAVSAENITLTGTTLSESTGSLTANTLTTGTGSFSGNVTLAGANSIGTLSAFTLGGNFDLNDSSALDIESTLTAKDVFLSAPTLSLGLDNNVAINAGSGDTLALGADDIDLASSFTGFAAPNGTIEIAPFTAGNIVDIGGVSASGTLGAPGSLISALATAAPEIIIGNGPVGHQASAIDIDNSPSFGGTTIVDLSTSGLITQNAGTFSAPTLEFDSGGFTQNTGATISAATLAGDGTPITGAVSLTGNNLIGELTAISLTTGTLTVFDTESLTAAGTVTAPTVSLTAPTIAVTGFVDATTELALGSSGTITESGSISAPSLVSIGAIGSATLTGTNSITALGGFTLSGNFALKDASVLDIAGAVTTPSTISLTGTSLTESTGSLAANTLTTGAGRFSGNVSLSGTSNTITNLGAFTVASGGTLTLDDTGALTVAGTISAPTTTISAANSIDITSDIVALTELALGSGGTITQTTGKIQTGSLISNGSIGGDVTLASISGNSISSLGDFTLGGTLSLADAISLDVTGHVHGTGAGSEIVLNDINVISVPGTITAPTLFLSAANSLTLSGSIDATSLLELGGGDITEPGSISTPSLVSIGAVRSATLTGTNSITALGNFTLTNDFALSDSHALDITGAVTTPGNITLSGTTLTESTGSAAANTLTTGAGNFSGNVSLSGASNTIANLGAFTVASGGTLTLDDTGTLTVAGTINAPTTTLSATSSIDIASGVVALTELALGSGGTITQTAGTISTGNLVSNGSIGGNVSLTSANSISGLGNFTLGGTLSLADATNLDVTGPVQGTGASSEILLSDTGTISAPGTLTAPTLFLSAANSIDLSGLLDATTLLELGGGTITQTGGTIATGSLSSDGAITGGVTLASATNTITTLGSFVTDGSFDLADTGTLNINGSVSAQNISLSVPTLSLDAVVNATLSGGTLALAADAFTITSGTLGANAGTIELAPFTSNHGIDLGGAAANALDLAGNFATAFGGGTVEFLIGAALGSKASFIDIDGSVSFASGTVDLATTGTILDNSGTLTAPTLEFDAASVTQSAAAVINASTLQGDGGAIGGNVLLAGANIIGTLGGLSLASGTLALTDAGTLNVTGSVSAPEIYLTDSNADGITMSGGSLIAASGTIGLTSDALGGTSGTISAPGGLVLIAPNTPAKSIDFGGTGVGGLELATGFIDLIGSQVLQIGTGGGTITQEQNFTIAPQTLVLDGTSINLTGSLGVPTLFSFASTGAVSEAAAATISVPTLTGTASGTIGLIGTNAIGTLGAVSAGGNITINNGPSLLIAGLVASGLGDSITLDDQAGITEVSGGTLSAGTLTTGTGSIAGAAVLSNNNTIGTIAGFTATGDLTFLDSGALTLAGPLSAADAYITGSGIGITGSVNAGAGTLGLFSSNGITEAAPGGVITAGTLTGTVSAGNATLLSGNSISNLGAFTIASGNLTLGNAIGLNIAAPVQATGIALSGTSLTETGGTLTATALSTGAGDFTGNVSLTGINTINTLGGFTLSAGTLTLDDTGLLTIDGPVNAPFTTLSAQTMAIAGTISASSGLALESTGNIYETLTGFIDTPSLTSGGTDITGNVSLANSNSIATLASFTTNGDLTLDDAGALTVAGPVSVANATLSADGIIISGGIGATLLSLASGGVITEPGGIITAATLTGTSADATSLLDANTITTLSGFSVTSGNFGIGNTSVLDIAGLVSASGTITLEGVGDTEITGGTLVATTLNSGGTAISGNVALGNANQIGTLGGFTLGGGDTLSLQDAALTVAGPVIAPVATLSAGGISILGTITDTTSLALESTGNITEASGGIIDTPSLTSGGGAITGNVSLTSAQNTINTLGAFSLGTGSTLALDDTGLLTVAGPVSTPFATISADTLAVSGAFSGTSASFSSGTGGIGVTGSISLTTILDLASMGNVTESGAGAISAATLVSAGGSIHGNVLLENALNAIGTLGNFTIGAGDTLDIADSGLLTVAGTVAAPFATLSSDTINVTGTLSGTSAELSAGTGGIGITGLIDTGGILALASTGNITESGTGGIDAGTLISAGIIGGNVLLANTLDNAIGTLGGFTIGATDTLVLDESGLLTVAGPVSAANATLYAGTLAIDGALTGATQTLSGGTITIDAPISVTNLLALESGGNITETSTGTITTPVLTSGGTTTGTAHSNYVSLTSAANSIGTLGGFAAAGTFDLVDSGLLDVTGPVQGPTLSLTSGTINFSGVVDASGELALGGALVTENSGEIITSSLVSIGSIAGDVSLTSPNNTINTLGNFVSGGTLKVADTGLLTVAGTVGGPFISLSSDSIAFTGIVNAGTLLALGSTGNITQTGGDIVAPTLTSIGNIGGNVSLVSASNTIGTLGAFTIGGTLDLIDTGFLTVAGPVQGNVVSLSSGTLDLAGIVNAGSLIALGSTGNITQSGGLLQGPTLASIGTIGGDASLISTNAIGTLGGFTVGNTLTLDNGTLAVAGPVIAPYTTLSAAGISITGTISASSELALESTGGITEISSALMTTPTLTSGGTTITGGNAAFSGTLNSIGTLGSFAETDDIDLTDDTTLIVDGPLTADNVNLTAPALAIFGSVNAAGTVAITSSGSITLPNGDEIIDNNAFLDINAPVDAVDVYVYAPGIGIFAGVSATGTLGLDSSANITESGAGIITAETLTGTSADAVSLLTGNAITSLGAFSVTSGGFSIDNASNLDIAGLVTVGMQDMITLEDAAGITESTGRLIAGTLNSGGTVIDGNVALTNSLNNIGALGGFTVAAGDTLTLDDTALTVAGPVVAPVATLSAGSIAITGTISASNLALESTGNITETGGFITTTSLTSGGTTIGGNAALIGTNVINTLSAFSDAGTLTLDDTGLLAVAGPVTAPVATLSSPTIAINGVLNAATQLALESTGNITEGSTGAVTTAQLTSGGTNIGGNVTLNSALNTITTLGQFAAAGLALNDHTPLAITAPVAVSGVLGLLDAGNVTQTGGTISAGTLTSDGGTIGGEAAFNQSGNDIPVLGAFGAVAGLALSDAVPLNLAGNIFTGSSAPLSLTDTGGAITQGSGAINSGTLNADGPSVTLGQANAIGTAGSITATNAYVNGIAGISGPIDVTTGTFLSAGLLPVTGNISASSNLVLEALGGISQSTGNIAAGAATLLAGGDIILSGLLDAGGDLDLVSGGNISHPAGLLKAGTLSGAVGGTVVTALGTVDGTGTLADFNFSSLTTDFGTIGNFIMQDSTFALNNDGPLMLLGSLVANTVSITTNGDFTFEGTSNGAGGGLFIDANPVAATAYFTPQPGDSVITVNNGGITQTGIFDINTPNGLPANLFLYINDGSALFSTTGELYAPTTNLEISDAQGAISGNVVLQRLVVLNALTQSVQLTGQLDGLGGQAAASKGFVDPFPEPEFRFNACPIGSVNCTILPVETLPPGNPLENFDLTQRKRSKLNNNVHLPGVATRDF